MIAPPTPVTGSGNECGRRRAVAQLARRRCRPSTAPSRPRAARSCGARRRDRASTAAAKTRPPASRCSAGPVAELAGVVLSPAARAAVSQQRAAVIAAHRDRRRSTSGPRPATAPAGWRSSRRPPDRRRSTPSRRPRRRRERAGVVAARRHGADAAEAGDPRRRRRVGLAAVAELPVGVRSPARRRCRRVARAGVPGAGGESRRRRRMRHRPRRRAAAAEQRTAARPNRHRASARIGPQPVYVVSAVSMFPAYFGSPTPVTRSCPARAARTSAGGCSGSGSGTSPCARS